MFDKLIWTVLSYGVEIWRWAEREKLEKLEERYLRWILGENGHQGIWSGKSYRERS